MTVVVAVAWLLRMVLDPMVRVPDSFRIPPPPPLPSRLPVAELPLSVELVIEKPALAPSTKMPPPPPLSAAEAVLPLMVELVMVSVPALPAASKSW